MNFLAQPPFRRHARPAFFLIVVLTVLGPVATHIIIPALPAMASSLQATPGTIQQTIMLYLIGLAVGQLVYGPLSDRYGRRPLVLAGLLLFVLACAFASLAASIDALLVARVIQALGACSGMVLGRAILRDVSSGSEVARLMAILITVLAIGPAIAPTIGGYVTSWLGWRAIFVLMGGIGAITLLVSLLTLPETNRSRTMLPGWRPMLDTHLRLLRMPSFRGNAIGGCCITTSLYAFFAASPFIFTEVLERPVDEIGFYYLFILGSASAGGYFASRLAGRFGAGGLARAGSWVQIAGASVLMLVDLAGATGIPTVVGPVMVIAAAAGFAGPMAIASAVSADPRAIGTASGLYGFMQMVFGALCTLAVSLWQTDSVLPVAVILLLSALAGKVAFAHASK